MGVVSLLEESEGLPWSEIHTMFFIWFLNGLGIYSSAPKLCWLFDPSFLQSENGLIEIPERRPGHKLPRKSWDSLKSDCTFRVIAGHLADIPPDGVGDSRQKVHRRLYAEEKRSNSCRR